MTESVNNLPVLLPWTDNVLKPDFTRLHPNLSAKHAELIATLRAEADGGGWVVDAEQPFLGVERAVHEQIGLGLTPCPACGGQTSTGTVNLPCHGIKTGVKALMPTPCRCRFNRDFYRLWSGEESLVPKSQRWVRLHELKFPEASVLPKENQRKRIKFLQENPDISYLFVGVANSSKTVYATALLEHCIAEWALDNTSHGTFKEHGIFRVIAEDWLNQWVEYATRREGELSRGDEHTSLRPALMPTLNPRHIRLLANRGIRCHVFIEELNKVSKMTDFKIAKLHEMFNAMTETGGQIVGTANGTKAELVEQHTEELLRRFVEPDHDTGRHGQILEYPKPPSDTDPKTSEVKPLVAPRHKK